MVAGLPTSFTTAGSYPAGIFLLNLGAQSLSSIVGNAVMPETWLQWCVKRPGPDWKGGYTDAPALGTLDEKEGEVKHSAEGPLASLFHELDRPDRTASWTFSLAQDGLVYQHYPLEWRAWHAGVMGDRRFDTSLIGNLTLVGEEHEGGGPNNPSEPLTELQRASSIRLTRDVRRLCPHIGPPALRVNLWEHNWLSPTSCPSGRIPWPQILTALQVAMEEDMPKLIHCIDAGGKVYVIGEMGKRHIDDQVELGIYTRLFGGPMDVYQAEADKIPDVPSGSSGTAPVDLAAIAQAVRDKLKAEPLK